MNRFGLNVGLRGRAEPHVPVESGRRRTVGRAPESRRRLVADVPRVDPVDLAERARLDDLDGLLEVQPRSLLRADLHDAVVLARRVDHRAAFLDVVRDRLLDVDVLARLAGHDHRDRVPVIDGRDDHRVEVVALDDAPEVGLHRRGAARLLLGHLLRAPAVHVPHVAHGDDLHVVVLLEVVQVRTAHAADADRSDADRDRWRRRSAAGWPRTGRGRDVPATRPPATPAAAEETNERRVMDIRR